MLAWQAIILKFRSEIGNVKQYYPLSIPTQMVEEIINKVETLGIHTDKNKIWQEYSNPQYKEAMSIYIDATAKVTADNIEKNKHYTQIIMTAGYATFFGLWSISGDYLPDFVKLLAITFIAISAAVFVIHECLKMYAENAELLIRSELLMKAKLQDDYEKINDSVKRIHVQNTYTVLYTHKFWSICFFISIITGVIGIGLLMSSYVISLWNLYCSQSECNKLLNTLFT